MSNVKDEVKQEYLKDLGRCESEFAKFLREVHADYRHLGIIIMEAFTRSTFDDDERELMLRPNYTFADLNHYFNLTRASKGLNKLLKFCFMQVPVDQAELIKCIEDTENYKFQSSFTLPEIDDILSLLEKDMADMGGVNVPDMTPAMSFLTAEDRKEIEKEKSARKAAMAAKAAEGRRLAVDRVVEHKKQVD